MPEPIIALEALEAESNAPPLSSSGLDHNQWQARYELARHRAETERLRVLVDFLSRPVHAHGGPDPDPDIVTAYNLAVEAALREVRRAALASG